MKNYFEKPSKKTSVLVTVDKYSERRWETKLNIGSTKAQMEYAVFTFCCAVFPQNAGKQLPSHQRAILTQLLLSAHVLSKSYMLFNAYYTQHRIRTNRKWNILALHLFFGVFPTGEKRTYTTAKSNSHSILVVSTTDLQILFYLMHTKLNIVTTRVNMVLLFLRFFLEFCLHYKKFYSI